MPYNLISCSWKNEKTMIADTFIKRPITAIVISIVIVLVGLIALTTLPVAQYPDITPPAVSVTANFTGSDAETVEQTVTTAIETQINGTPGMSYLSSNSTSSGQSSVTVSFDIGTNIDIAAARRTEPCKRGGAYTSRCRKKGWE